MLGNSEGVKALLLWEVSATTARFMSESDSTTAFYRANAVQESAAIAPINSAGIKRNKIFFIASNLYENIPSF